MAAFPTPRRVPCIVSWRRSRPRGSASAGAPQPPARPVLGANWWYKMTRAELIIQLLKVVIGLAFGAYFVWWSLEVLDRLTPDHEVPAAVVGRAF